MLVALKMIFKEKHPYEAGIHKFLTSGALAHEPSNRCIPLYDLLEVPDNEDMLILVMPFLRACHDPRFETIGEALDFFRQVIEVDVS